MTDTLTQKHILVIRFSAMGDVAIAVPVLKQLLSQYPNISISFISQQKFEPLFNNIERLYFYSADLYGKHKGFLGLYRLFKTLKTLHKFDGVADLHNVLRSKIIRFFFKFSGYKVRYINKGRTDKKALTQKKNKLLIPLKNTAERYADVFQSFGFKIDLNHKTFRTKLSLNPILEKIIHSNSSKKIGIAPFAQYKEKTYPAEKMIQVIEILISKGYQILLFGGGIKEIEMLNQWEKEFKNISCIAGRFSLQEELALISNLDVMISMDSANMHLACLYGVPVISIWGATHPYAGFYGYGQNAENAVQIDLYCRPCSVFGNKVCYRGDWACMNTISPEMVTQKVLNVIKMN